jgi:putative ABC transport system substrate-binding protein
VCAALVCVLSAALLTPARAADAGGKVLRLGILYPSPPGPGSRAGDIRDDLARLGWTEGRNLAILRAYGDRAEPARLAQAAAELMAQRVDVVLGVTSPAAFAAKAASRDVPVVVWGAHAAVETGLVDNLRRPGGTVTGTESLAPELDAKRIELLKQVLPGLRVLAVLHDANDEGTPQHLSHIRRTGAQLGVSDEPLPIRSAGDIGPAFATLGKRRFDGLLTLTSWLTGGLWPQIQPHADARRLATLCEFRFMAQQGCLLSYGPTFSEFNARCAAQIDKIARGTPPGELPIEQPTRFELAINLKTAKALGLSVPRELLLRADEVIE